MNGLDAKDRAIVNRLQGGFPLTSRPYLAAAESLGMEEDELLARLRRLVETGRLSRFGPLWNAEGLGGEVCLCAMAAPADRFEEIAELVNAHPEVAHNYERSHELNMWFVISAEREGRIKEVVAEIEAASGLKVYAMPKRREFFVGFQVEV